jgi:hypothetical protein
MSPVVVWVNAISSPRALWRNTPVSLAKYKCPVSPAAVRELIHTSSNPLAERPEKPTRLPVNGRLSEWK